MAEQKSSKVYQALKNAYKHGQNAELDIHVNRDKLIIFSDHHRGAGNAAGKDDFYPCRNTYSRALDHYFNEGYKLVLLGDVEELWENLYFNNIFEKYKTLYQKEAQFYSTNVLTNRYFRVFGNHDVRWESQDHVQAELWPGHNNALHGLIVYEGIKLHLADDLGSIGNAYLVHGHQGQYNSEFLTMVKEIAVAGVFGPLQDMIQKQLNNSPYKNPHLGAQVNKGCYRWANVANTLLFAGHTHHTVSSGFYWPEGHKVNAGLKTHPLLFNSGCCSFSNGSITCIEIADGEVKLIEWTNSAPHQEDGLVSRFERTGRGLRDIFS